MKTKLSFALLGLSLWMFVALCCAPSFAKSPAEHKVIVYYLYFNPRCDMCINMELYSKEALESAFADELEGGIVEWHSIDMDSTEHAHFWNDFNLETKALVMVDLRDGEQVRWKNCERIWFLAERKVEFMAYVQKELRDYLENP